MAGRPRETAPPPLGQRPQLWHRRDPWAGTLGLGRLGGARPGACRLSPARWEPARSGRAARCGESPRRPRRSVRRLATLRADLPARCDSYPPGGPLGVPSSSRIHADADQDPRMAGNRQRHPLVPPKSMLSRKSSPSGALPPRDGALRGRSLPLREGTGRCELLLVLTGLGSHGNASARGEGGTGHRSSGAGCSPARAVSYRAGPAGTVLAHARRAPAVRQRAMQDVTCHGQPAGHPPVCLRLRVRRERPGLQSRSSRAPARRTPPGSARYGPGW